MLKAQGVLRVAIALCGLVIFCAVMGFALYAWLVDEWPEVPFAFAIVLSIVAPLAFLLAVGIIGATLDKLAGRTMPGKSEHIDSDAH